MIKNLQKLVSNKNLSFQKLNNGLINNFGQISKFTTSSNILLASKNKNESNNDEDGDLNGYLKSNLAKAKNLERMGLIKPHASWPQYNRIIYPPSEDGKPTKTPVG